MRKNGKTNAVGRGGALLRPAGYTELSKIFGESVCTYPLGRRGRCPHRPGRMHRFYGNLRRICNFSMGRQSRRPLQQPFALSVGADDSVCPRDVPILRESSANSQLPPYIQRGNCLRIRRKFSKEFTAFCRAEQSPAPTKIVRIFGGAPKSAAVESAQRKTGNRSFWFSCVYIFSRVMRTQETSTKSSVCSPFATRTACWTAT